MMVKLMLFWTIFTVTSFTLTLLDSPFIATLVLVAASLIAGSAVSFFALHWMFFTIIILFVGGMMVLFMYTCALTSSLKTESNKFKMIGLILLPLTALGVSSSTISLEVASASSSFYAIFTERSLPVMLFLILYLLLGLVVAVAFAKKIEGPLKNKFTHEV